MFPFPKPKLLGTVTVGERGQVAIPVEGRTILGLEPGDKLLVFLAPGGGGLVLAQPDAFEEHIRAIQQQAGELLRQPQDNQ
jgi:AbrB family looped-hinge helix DNA binding protein